METDTKANEEGNQRQNDASGAIALLPGGDLVREEERRHDSKTGDAASRCYASREESPQRDPPIQEHVGRPPPEEHGENEREQKDETATAHRARLVEEPDLNRDVEDECHDPRGLIGKVPQEALRGSLFV